MTDEKKEELVEESVEESVEVKEGETRSTDHDHYYTEGDVHGNLKDVYCIECGNGHQVNKDITIINGKIIWNKE